MIMRKCDFDSDQSQFIIFSTPSVLRNEKQLSVKSIRELSY